MQGHFSIYCRLFPPGALSNSLRNLLEVNCNISYTINLTEKSPRVYSGCPHSRIRSSCQSPKISQWTVALQLPTANKFQPSDHSTPREMLLPADTPPAIADTLGYLQHHLQELTKRQNTSEHTINTTLTGLTAQLQQLTQLITTPAPTVALPPILPSLPPVSPPSPVLSALSK